MSFKVFNATDGIFASPGSFRTREQAERFLTRFRSRFENDGYLTSARQRIPASEIRLEITDGESRPRESQKS